MAVEGATPRRYFFSYRTAMAELNISRRTLQRWIDDMEITPLEFPDHLKVFLTGPHMDILREYSKVMKTRNNVLIARFRKAVITGNARLLAKIHKELGELSQ
jgi:hypothetical protein